MRTVEPLNPTHEREYDDFYATYRRAYDRPFDVIYGPREKRVALRSNRWRERLAATVRSNGAVVGGAAFDLPLLDNTERVYADLWIAPEHRRRGHGTALLEWVVGQARAAGRELISMWAGWGIDDPDGAGNAAGAFLRHHGFADELLEAHRALALPLRSEPPAAPVAAGYQLVSWRDQCPERLLGDYARLRGLIAVEAPSGEHGFEVEEFDGSRVRLEEAELAESGRLSLSVGALSPDGRLIGHTHLVIPSEDLHNAHQWDTLVLPEHRGHGLGLALKAANLRQAAPHLVGRTQIHTWNAASNEHMIRVNEALGFRLIAHEMEMVLAC